MKTELAQQICSRTPCEFLEGHGTMMRFGQSLHVWPPERSLSPVDGVSMSEQWGTLSQLVKSRWDRCTRFVM